MAVILPILLFGLIFVLLAGYSLKALQQTSDGYWSSKRAQMICPYCGVKGHGKEFHTPK